MPEDKSSYKQMMKATSLFGGVQIFNIIISIIRSKFVAVLLGPAGMGISGLLTSTTGLISGLTNFGLGTSAVKDVAEANATGDENRIATIAVVLRRWVWITGLLGTIITIVFSPWLSQLTFGNKQYTIAFVWLSITLLFQQLSSGQLVLLQGMRKLQYLAKANMTGNVIGLIISLPLYYFFKLDGIIPAIILSSLTAMALSWYFSGKVQIQPVKVSRNQTLYKGKGMIKLGFMLSLSGLISVGVGYLVRIYISNTGGVNEVGLYNAGFAIINTYVGLVFTAMATDYYPRLAAVSQNNLQAKQLINQQSEIAIIILAPILIVFIIFIHWVVILLYSFKFLSINAMIHWAALGMFFKAVSWSIAFIFVAKGESKLFFLNELLANFYLLFFSLVGYKIWGLNGLGISFLLTYVIYLIQVFFIAKKKYHFSFNKESLKLFTIQFILALLCFFIVRIFNGFYVYLIGTGLISFSLWYSFKELDKRIGIMNIIKNYARK